MLNGVDNISYNSRGGGELACAPAVEQNLAYSVAGYHYGIEDVVNTGKGIVYAYKSWADGCHNSRFGVFYKTYQLDGIAGVFGVLNIVKSNFPDTRAVDVFGIDVLAKRQRA